MKKDVCITMAKRLIYTGANDFIFNKTIYVMDNLTALEKISTTERTAVQDICNICERKNIEEIHLYGPVFMMNKMKQDILEKSNKFNYQNITFFIN